MTGKVFSRMGLGWGVVVRSRTRMKGGEYSAVGVGSWVMKFKTVKGRFSQI